MIAEDCDALGMANRWHKHPVKGKFTLDGAKQFARELDEDGLLLLGPTLRIVEHGKTLKWTRSDLVADGRSVS
jgi:hypothetical protein